MICRHCQRVLRTVFLDLGFAPPSNHYLRDEDLTKPERYLPLKLYVCEHCWLVQTQDFAAETDLFTADYAYFSSTSTSWLAHAARYARMVTERFELSQASFVMEIASNDGYLLKNFVTAGIPCLGIEPTASTAAAAEALGIPVHRRFFGESLARELVEGGKQADLIVGNNVFAHVPDVNDFARGVRLALKPEGIVTLEFPHLMRLLEGLQFDTVYHEHFSYLSLTAVGHIFAAAGMRVFDVEELPTHGGSLRVYGCRIDAERAATPAVNTLLAEEAQRGLLTQHAYRSFQNSTYEIRDNLLLFLIEQRRAGRRVVAYGAAAKGNTLLNFAGIKPDLIAYVCDAAASKQGKFMPGSHIPIRSPDALAADRPDVVLILPWNLREELARDLAFIAEWGGTLMVAVPRLEVVA